ncbi:hypothetical protein [Sphingomonas sp. 28-63-12]|uniref:hypothetical protein n=1 Tax=Sphingomonas sp. 28-63-12 TaxID=1970434 RepID=UPI000BD3EFDD|nr:MAG: hypothetical protein B7Y47_07180 [Sphingomonas sp. 28-63-12]
MRAILILVGLAALAVVGAWSLGFISIDQSKVAQAPQLKLEGGQVPEFTVNMAKIEIGTENKTIDVPTVGTTQKTISVPTMTVEKPANAQDAQ